MSLLQCIKLVKQFPGKRAVDGVSFHVDPGEVVGLLGPNGAGKSTSFSMAVGLVTPTEGRVIFNGTDVTRWPLYKIDLGYDPWVKMPPSAWPSLYDRRHLRGRPFAAFRRTVRYGA